MVYSLEKTSLCLVETQAIRKIFADSLYIKVLKLERSLLLS